jgi:hypothetical protein
MTSGARIGPKGATESGGELAMDSARLMEEFATDVGDLEMGDLEV